MKFQFKSKFFALLLKLLSLETWLTKGLSVPILEETGSKFLFTLNWRLLRSFNSVKVVSTQIRYLHLPKLEHKSFTRRIVPRSFKCNPLWFNILSVMFALSTKTIFSSSHFRFNRLFIFFPLSLNLSFRKVTPETTTVFFCFFYRYCQVHYVSCYIFCVFIIFKVIGSEMKDNCIRGVVFQASSNMMFHTLCCCARDRFYNSSRS